MEWKVTCESWIWPADAVKTFLSTLPKQFWRRGCWMVLQSVHRVFQDDIPICWWWWWWRCKWRWQVKHSFTCVSCKPENFFPPKKADVYTSDTWSVGSCNFLLAGCPTHEAIEAWSKKKTSHQSTRSSRGLLSSEVLSRTSTLYCSTCNGYWLCSWSCWGSQTSIQQLKPDLRLLRLIDWESWCLTVGGWNL